VGGGFSEALSVEQGLKQSHEEAKLLGTVHKPRGLIWRFSILPPSFVVLRIFFFFLCEGPPPPYFPNKKHVAFLKWVFTGRLFTSQKNCDYHYYLLYFMQEIRYNVNQL